MVRHVCLGVFLSCFVPMICAAQNNQERPPSAPAQPVSAAPTSEKTKKVWTNEDIKSSGQVSVIGDPQHQNYPMTKPPDPALVAKYKASLQKLQAQLDDVNKQLQAYKDFRDGKAVSESGQDFSHSYSRTPVNQQIAKLQAKKKQLEDDMDALFEESRKKGIESGMLK